MSKDKAATWPCLALCVFIWCINVYLCHFVHKQRSLIADRVNMTTLRNVVFVTLFLSR